MKYLDRKFLTSSLLMFAICFTSVSFTFARFDEGMFTPDKLDTLSLNKKGLKIKPSEIYNPAVGGISEAIIRLDTGCTGEFVSSNGLILTNHHCAFDGLVTASSVEKDYAKHGYKADSIKDELPAKGFAISIPIRVEDVTAKVLAGTENLNGEARDNAIKTNIENLEKTENAKVVEGNTVRVQAVSSGYFYYLYENKQIKDIRIVYAPPQNIGFFGGDPDNFEWARHTGDFTFLRAYVAPDGKSAEYSPNNVPFKPRKHLTLSIAGIKENDFVFIMGNPGGTTRYRESQAVKYQEDVNFQFLYSYLTAWIGAVEKVSQTDEAKRIALQSLLFNLTNSQKVYQGGILALRRANLVGQRQAEETRFTNWVESNPARKAKYGTLLADIAKVSDEFYKTGKRDRLIRTIPGPANTGVVKEVFDALGAVSTGTKLSDQKRAAIGRTFENREPMIESDVMKYFFQQLADLPTDQKFATAETLFGNSTGKDRRDAEAKFVDSIVNNSDFDSADKVAALYSMSATDLKAKYPQLFDFAVAYSNELGAIAQRTNNFNSEINNLRVSYMRGISEMKGATPYPDANFTQRFTYGYVKGYSPREAVYYSPLTTLKGVIDKDSGVFPFDVPQKLKDLQNARDFGRFGVGDSVPVNFLSTNDIIGGNSGSPVLNAKGEQIGIAFDGNYEGLGNDMFYSSQYGRTISVDIRYVLFVTEKFGNAGWILNEMTIKTK